MFERTRVTSESAVSQARHKGIKGSGDVRDDAGDLGYVSSELRGRCT